MILIQILLVIVFALLLMRVLVSPNSSRIKAWKKIIACLFAVFAVVAVLFPEILDDVAHEVGVGRGADLLLYLLCVAFLSYVLNQYLRTKDDEYQIHKLARKIALLEAELKTKAEKK